jgi:hypothetical protein
VLPGNKETEHKKGAVDGAAMEAQLEVETGPESEVAVVAQAEVGAEVGAQAGPADLEDEAIIAAEKAAEVGQLEGYSRCAQKAPLVWIALD